MGLTVSRQNCRLILTVKSFKAFQTCFISISADRRGLLDPDESNSKLENQFPCSQKHSL